MWRSADRRKDAKSFQPDLGCTVLPLLYYYADLLHQKEGFLIACHSMYTELSLLYDVFIIASVETHRQ